MSPVVGLLLAGVIDRLAWWRLLAWVIWVISHASMGVVRPPMSGYQPVIVTVMCHDYGLIARHGFGGVYANHLGFGCICHPMPTIWVWGVYATPSGFGVYMPTIWVWSVYANQWRLWSFTWSWYIYIYFYSYNMLTRDMTKIYAQFTRARSARVRVRIFSHIPSNHVITVIFYTPVDENDYR